MQAYSTPGVYIEDVLTEPARVLRTGVPVFLGLIRMSHLDEYDANQVKLAETFVCKPLPRLSGVCIVRNAKYLSLPQRTFPSASDPGISDRFSNNLSLYLKATGSLTGPAPRDRQPAGDAGGGAEQAESPKKWSAAELQAISSKPQRFTVWPQFEHTYGGLKPFGFLSYAVRGFFENGGPLCYVQIIGYDGDASDAVKNAVDAGLATLEAYDDYDLVCAPDLMWVEGSSASSRENQAGLIDLQDAVLRHCDRLGDRMAILDSLPRADADADAATVLKHFDRLGDQQEDCMAILGSLPGADAATVLTVLSQRSRINGENGALYFPWVRVLDGPSQTGEYVPPCGHIAGVYARCDQRVGVHKAPANEILEGVLELKTTLTDDQQGPLNDVDINCLRVFPRRGIRVWGARTLSSGFTWRYVNERRVILTAARWIERNLTDIVFEPHTPRLWDRIVRELTAYLTDLVRLGALSAPPGSQAFYVKCDAEINPREIQEAGMVVTEIGLKPAAPAEFIVIRILHGPTGVRIEEVGL